MQIGAPLVGRAAGFSSFQAAFCLRASYTIPGPFVHLSSTQTAKARKTLFNPLAHSSSSYNGSSAPTQTKAGKFKLIIYSKPDCPLCDGLKEKVSGLLRRAEFQQSLLSGAKLEVRDIMSNPEWEAAYSMAIPVLAHSALDGSHEQKVPRPAPRLSADRLERHIVEALGGVP